MKKIIIISTGMRIGGVERSLLGLLNELDYEKYKVSLFLWAHEGEFMSMIPPQVELLPEDRCYASLERPIKSVLFSKSFPIAFTRLAAKFVRSLRSTFLGINGFLLPRSTCYSIPFLPAIQGKYDLAISFLAPHDPVIHKINATKKIGWVHTDYSIMECGVDHTFEVPVWEKLDSIAAVSSSVKDTFQTVFHSIKGKLCVIENIISPTFVKKQAEMLDVSNEMPKEPGEFRICSVGRFCHAKNFDSIPEIVKLINATGVKIRWYLIGFGSDEALIRQRIKDECTEDQVVILGKKVNPYPYIKACDIYVQPSRYEGKAVTVREAQILEKPVLITNFPTANSQLEDGVDGLICPLNTEGIAEGIITLIKDTELSEQLAKTASSRDYSSHSEIEKIYQLVDGTTLT